MKLVKEQAHSARPLSAGIAALPGVGKAFASTQAAWRFFNHKNITPPLLAAPLRQAVRDHVAGTAAKYVLAALDWSKIDYRDHTSKKDRKGFCNPGEAGYTLASVLAVDAADGNPIGPLEVELESAAGTRTTRGPGVREAFHPLVQAGLLMRAAPHWDLPARPVFVMDREYDSVEHYRAWNALGQLFVVRADLARRVTFEGESILLKDLVEKLRKDGKFKETRQVDYKGRPLPQFVAEAEVTLDGPAYKRDADGKPYKVKGEPLTLRLVVAEVRDAEGKAVATWLLFTNVPADVPAAEIALWYYWRWRIETFFKLLKSAGVELEEWQQETAGAILNRLLVACMACVTVWRLEALDTPAAEECKALLVRLSGRQMKRSRPVTTPALLAGLRCLLVIEEVLDQYGIAEIRRLAKPVLDYLKPP